MVEESGAPENYRDIRIYKTGNTLGEYGRRYTPLLKDHVFPVVKDLKGAGLIKRYHFLSHSGGAPEGVPKLDLRVEVVNPESSTEDIGKIVADRIPGYHAPVPWGGAENTPRSLMYLHNISEVVRLFVERGHNLRTEPERVARLCRYFNGKVGRMPAGDVVEIEQDAPVRRLLDEIAVAFLKSPVKYKDTESPGQIIHFIWNASGIWGRDEIAFLMRFGLL